jgi:hypothetical protein
VRCGTTHAQPDDVVDAGASAGDGGLDRRMQAVVCDGQRSQRLGVGLGTLRVVSQQGADLVVWRAGTGRGRVGGMTSVWMRDASQGSDFRLMAACAQRPAGADAARGVAYRVLSTSSIGLNGARPTPGVMA